MLFSSKRMTTNQKVWYITLLVVLICLLGALLIYHFTGHIFLAIIIAPPLVHYFLKRRSGNSNY